MRLLLLLLPAAALASCSSAPPYSTTVGILKPGATLEVRVAQATLNAYQPENGQRRDLFTVAATVAAKAKPPPAPRLLATRHGVVVNAPSALQSLLVRVPDAASLAVQSRQGDVNVTDIRGSAIVVASHGNVTMMLPAYGQAAVGQGNVTATIGSTDWPGTLHFSTQRGDVVLRVPAIAAFAVHLHTGSGTLFTNFALRGTSQGSSETIDGSVNGGGARRIDVEVTAGSIRLLKLQPQP
ncbi:MAG TPA: DUF4097 family beta strand repeat-containing protein [Candidatus Binatia bacterium]|nr:DUF4097 family beta strand repeat-containing protein [Candidatus Binatia bacterium]